MNNDTPLTTEKAPALLQANVDYLPGITIKDAQSALLEWSADNRIKLFILGEDGATASDVLFDVALNEITEVKGSIIMLTFVIGDKTFNTQFSTTATMKLGIGGGIGLGAAYKDVKSTGILLWIDKLRANNVKVAGIRDANWIAKASLVGAAICIGIALLATFIIVLVAVLNN